MQRADFDFELPDALIAQHPLPGRTDSRLLDCRGDALTDRGIGELPSLLRAGDALIFNDTRVIKARLHGTKETGGRVEILVERVDGEREVRAQIRASHAPKVGSRLTVESLAGTSVAVVDARDGDFFALRFDDPVAEVLDRHGSLPLPPYIEHAPDDVDMERYQTVWAKEPGAVAAPTAGLHFDRALLDGIATAGVATAALTLHVGAGTFMPVRAGDLAQHVMHEERYVVPPAVVETVAETRARGGRVVAVGTTTLRALESAADTAGNLSAGPGATRLFITPGYQFRVVDLLVTNFHLPQSTLLMLVSAFAGTERIRQAYRHAIDRRYRFFSYGDAMLLDRAR